MSKLRKRETLSFRPDTDAEDQLIHDAQKATGIKMAELLRRSVLIGLPSVVAEIKATQHEAFAQFEQLLHDGHKPYRTKDPPDPKRKAG